MKTRETKQKDLVALTESLKQATSAMVVSFTKLTVNKDIEFRNNLREAGARYQVVKNTLARIAVKDTQYEQATEHFKGVTAIAWTENDPVILSKAMAKFMKDNADIYTFKAGVVDGRLLDLTQIQSIASLPSKEELISKMLWVLNAQAQRIVTVINAVPRDLAVVIKQIGEKAPAAAAPAVEAKAEVPAEVKSEEAPAPAVPELSAPSETPAETQAVESAPAAEAESEAAPAPGERLLEIPVVETEGAPFEETAPPEEPANEEPAAEEKPE